MIKLIVADFDGTLMPYGEKSVSEKVIKKIKDYLSEGISFAVASGRTYSELTAYFSEISKDVFFIADDGAIIIKNNNVIFTRPFSKNSIKKIFEDERVENANLYSLNKVYKHNTPDFSDLGKTPVSVKRAFNITEDVYKIIARVNKTDFEDCENFRVHYNGGDYVELINPYVNKGTALSYLQLHLSISKSETVAIGDSYNDLPMFRNATETFCVSEKAKELSLVSKHHTSDVLSAFQSIDLLKQH